MSNRSSNSSTVAYDEKEQRAVLAPSFAYHVHALLRKFASIIIGTSFFTLLYFPSFISSLLCIILGFELRDLLGNNLRDFVNNVLLDSSSSTAKSNSRYRSKPVYSSSESRLATLYNLGIAIVVFSIVETVIMMGLGIDSMVLLSKGYSVSTLIAYVIVGCAPIICVLHIGVVTLVHHITYRCLNWPLVDPVPGALQGNTMGAIVVVTDDANISTTEINTTLNHENPLDDISLDLQKALASLYQSFLATVSKVLFVTSLLFAVYVPSFVSAMIGVSISISLGNLTYSSSLQFWANIQNDSIHQLSRRLGRRARRCTCAVACCSSSILNLYNLCIAWVVFSILEMIILASVLPDVLFSDVPLSVFSWILWSFMGQVYIIGTYGSYAALLWFMVDQVSVIPLVDNHSSNGRGNGKSASNDNDGSQMSRDDDPSTGQSITSTIREWAISTSTKSSSSNNGNGTSNSNGMNDTWEKNARTPFVPGKNSYDAVPNYGSANTNNGYSAPSYASPPSTDPPQFSSVRSGSSRNTANDAFVNQVLSLVNPKAGDVATEQDCKNLVPRIIASAEEVLERNGVAVTDNSVNNLAEKTVRAVCVMHKVDMVTSNKLVSLVANST